MNGKAAKAMSSVCRYIDRASIAIVTALFLVLIGYGSDLTEATGQATMQVRMLIFIAALFVVVFGGAGALLKRQQPGHGFAMGAAVGLLLGSGTIAFGMLIVTDSLGKPLPALLLPVVGIVVIVGLLADITAIIVRHLPRKTIAVAG
ncbi:MAG: hypothetical protein L0G87_00605 [Renibacterium salmoninarum]|jgi:hypothetical protein|nr:hypothetical protein [Renibacterium salmoninarum]